MSISPSPSAVPHRYPLRRAEHAVVFVMRGQGVGGHDLGHPQRIVQIENQVAAVDGEAERRAAYPRENADKLAGGKIGVVLHRDLQAHLLRRWAGRAENGDRPIGQGDHVLAAVAHRPGHAHATQQRGTELAGYVEVVDHDLCLGDIDVVAGVGQQVPPLFRHRVPMKHRSHAEFDVQAQVVRRLADGRQIRIAKGVEGTHVRTTRPANPVRLPGGRPPRGQVQNYARCTIPGRVSWEPFRQGLWNVAFRSAKERRFRGAKGDTGFLANSKLRQRRKHVRSCRRECLHEPRQETARHSQ